MNCGEVIAIWRRRRALMAGLRALAVVGFLAAVAWLPRTYQAQAAVVLVPSHAASAVNGGNPYLSFTSSITRTADIVGRELMSAQAARQLAAAGFPESYIVGLDPGTAAGPILDIAVTGSNSAQVERALHALVAQVGLTLSDIQNRVRPRHRIRMTALVTDARPAIAVSRTARPMIVIAISGMVVALGCPLIVDGRSGSRRRQHEAASREDRRHVAAAR